MIRFVPVEDARELHDIIISTYGGCPGLLNPAGLASAVAQAQASWEGQYLHEDLAAMAAAYLFYIARGHPFTDGNKRTAGGVAYCFLLQNGFALSEELEVRVAYEALVMGVAEGRLSREDAAAFFRDHMMPDTD